MKSLKKISLVIAVPLLAVVGVVSAGVRTSSDDPAATYKTKCFACHGAKAEKKFDPAKSDDESVQMILNGKKMEKPPNMPGFEEKGITADQAKALIAYMKSLKQ